MRAFKTLAANSATHTVFVALLAARVLKARIHFLDVVITKCLRIAIRAILNMNIGTCAGYRYFHY